MAFDKIRSKLITPVPNDYVELPYMKRRATYRHMKNNELKDLLKAVEKQDEFLINSVLDTILDKCVIDIDGEPYESDKITLADRIYLLLMIRKSTFGDDCKIQLPHIKEDTNLSVNVKISQFEVKYQEDSLFTLLHLNDEVKISLDCICRKDEKDLETYLRSLKTDSLNDRRYGLYAAIIKNFFIKNEDGEFKPEPVTFNDKVKYILEYADKNVINQIENFLKNMDFGIKLETTIHTDKYSNEKEELHFLSFFMI